MAPLPITISLILPPKELAWTAVRSSGPGGQNVNKVSSKVVLRFQLKTSSALSQEVRDRAQDMFRHRLNRDGELCVACDTFRDQPRNLERAREVLRTLILSALHVPLPRVPTKTPRSAKRRRLSDKRVNGQKKSGRQSRSFGNDD